MAEFCILIASSMCLSPFPCICLLLYADFALLARGIHRQAICQPYQRYAEYKPKQAIFDADLPRQIAQLTGIIPNVQLHAQVKNTTENKFDKQPVTALAMARTGSRYRYNVSETNPISPKQIPPASAIDQCDQPRNRISKNGYPQNPYAIKIIVFSIRLKPHHLFFSVPCWAENILCESDISCLGRCVL